MSAPQTADPPSLSLCGLFYVGGKKELSHAGKEAGTRRLRSPPEHGVKATKVIFKIKFKKAMMGV